MDQIEYLRPIIFFSLLALLSIFQLKFPLQKYEKNKKRLFHNFSFFIFGIMGLRLLAPFGLYQLALQLKEITPYGLFSLIEFPIGIELFFTIILFDLLIYWQHRHFHQFHFLWRIHSVHHTDTNFDLTTGIRFHPLEILISACFKMVGLILLTPTAWMYLVYEIVLGGFALFTHANLKLPVHLNNQLQKLFVTPRFHTTHHGPESAQMNANYGNFLSLWDKFFKTYNPEEVLVFGLNDTNQVEAQIISKSLMRPFNSDSSSSHNQDSET